MKNQSRTIKTNPELTGWLWVVQVVTGDSQEEVMIFRDRQTLHHNIYIITNIILTIIITIIINIIIVLVILIMRVNLFLCIKVALCRRRANYSLVTFSNCSF